MDVNQLRKQSTVRSSIVYSFQKFSFATDNLSMNGLLHIGLLAIQHLYELLLEIFEICKRVHTEGCDFKRSLSIRV